MRGREFIAGFGTAAWPLAVQAQQADRMRHVEMLMGVQTKTILGERVGSPRSPKGSRSWTDRRPPTCA
jgi:hypothetical protein